MANKVQQSSIVDLVDREIVQLLQEDASLTARELAEHVGLTPTPCWRRVQNLEAAGVITKRVALVDPASVNLNVTALVQIRTNDHSAEWLMTVPRSVGTLSRSRRGVSNERRNRLHAARACALDRCL